MRAKYLWSGVGVLALGTLVWLSSRQLSPRPRLEVSQKGPSSSQPPAVLRPPTRGADAAAQTPQAAAALSNYQLAFAAPSLRTLDGIERTAHASNDAVLLARVELERTRVLRAAAGLPESAPVRQKGSEEP